MPKLPRTARFSLLFLFGPSIWAAVAPAEKADALLSGLVQTGDPGFAVLVAQDGKVIFEKGYGLADREHKDAVTPQTIFRIASITKQFTASAILKLQEEGKLSVDDTLSKYISDFPRGNEVTIRQLLNHTSGIHDYSPAPDHLSELARPSTVEDEVRMIKNQKPLYDFDPGTEWRYDNSGYELLGYIVQEVSGESFGDFLRERFFQPLGMTRTGVYREDLGLSQEARGYSFGPSGFEAPYYIHPSHSGGDGALYSTVEDLYRWTEGVFNGRVLGAASLKAAFTPVPTKASQLNSGNGYGFGWYVGPYRGLRDISHGGERPGFTSMMLRFPTERLSVIVLANSDGKPGVSASRLAYQMVDILLGKGSAQPTTGLAAAHPPYSPQLLPGKGLAEHDFLYCGEWDTRKPGEQSMFIVRGGRIVWHYSIPMRAPRGGIQEFDDVTMLPDGDILFSRMSGAGIVTRDKKLVWNYDAPIGTEVHSAQYLGNGRVLIMRNGTPAQAMIFDTRSNSVERVVPIPTAITKVHGQFRHIRMTQSGTILVPHLGEGKVVEYDLEGKAVWSVRALNVWAAVRLGNGNTLLSGDARAYLREVDPRGRTVWEFTQADIPAIKLFNIQGAERLSNGNTVFCNWCPNGAPNPADWPSTVQVIEVTQSKQLVWALRSWTPPEDLGTSTMIELLDQ